MFNFSHAARVTPNRVCCNALLAAYARAKPPQCQRVGGRVSVGGGCRSWGCPALPCSLLCVPVVSSCC
jgi:hypothetical protein